MVSNELNDRNRRQYQTARIKNVASNAVTVTTQSGDISIDYQLSEFYGNPPKVGEIWLISKLSARSWVLHNRVHNQATNVMRYGIRLDCRDCVGKERAIVDDIAGAGFDEVYLTVASDGIVYWRSERAIEYGLDMNDILKQLLDRFRHYDIDVICIIDSELWSDFTNEQYNVYQQKSVKGEYARKFSPSAAKEPIAELFRELYMLYGADVYAYCIDGIGLAGVEYDRNDVADTNYYAKYKVMPPETYVSTGVDVEYLRWRDFIAEEQRILCQSIADAIESAPLIGIVPPYTFCIVDSAGVGLQRSGISSDFSYYGWEYAGFPLKYQQSADQDTELRSFESAVAINARFGEGCTPLYILEIPDISQPNGIFSILAKYNASTVVVGNYNDYRFLSDENAIALWVAMEKYRVTEKNATDYNGLVLSMNSLQAANWGDDFTVDYMTSFYNMASSMIDKTENRLRILFDGDMVSESRYNDNASTCVFMVSNLSDDALETMRTLLKTSGKYLCIVGRCGYYKDQTKTRREYPLLDIFGDVSDGEREYIKRLSVDSGIVSDYERSFKIDLGATGIKLANGMHNRAQSYDQVQTDEGIANVVVPAPIFINGRHVYMAIDTTTEGLLIELASELYVYSMSRES